MLGDDRAAYALAAYDRLRRRVPASAEMLHDALHSPNRTRVQLAAALLLENDAPVPDQPLIDALIEALRDDEIPRGMRKQNTLIRTWVYNAANAARYLIAHIDTAESKLVSAMDSRDAQQSFLAAYCLAQAGRTAYADRITRIMIPHLRDNKISRDALLSANALHHLGESARSALIAALPGADAQARKFLVFLLANLPTPERGAAARESAEPLAPDHACVVMRDTLDADQIPLGLFLPEP